MGNPREICHGSMVRRIDWRCQKQGGAGPGGGRSHERRATEITVALAVIYFLCRATVEARYMTEQFPDAYPMYKCSTKILLPSIFDSGQSRLVRKEEACNSADGWRQWRRS